MSTDRFKDFEFMQFVADLPITVVGAGGIGSYLILHLARMHPLSITVWDFDKVETPNLGTQLVGQTHVGLFKTEAAKVVTHTLSDYPFEKVMLNNVEFTDGSDVEKITFAAVDSMKARKVLFEAWVNLHGDNPEAAFFDGRIGAMSWDTFTIIGGDTERINRYRKFLPDDSAIPEAGCTRKSTSHIGMLSAAYLIQSFINWVEDKLVEPTHGCGTIYTALFHQKIDGRTWQREIRV